MTIPAYPWHWIEEDLKPSCDVKDLEGNHCPEPPTRKIDDGVYLCDKCYRNYIQQIRYERKYQARNKKVPS